MTEFSNVSTLPARQGETRGAVETLVDVLKECEQGIVEDVIVITRAPDGRIDCSWSSQGTGDIAEAAMFFQRAAGDFVEAMNARRDDAEEETEG